MEERGAALLDAVLRQLPVGVLVADASGTLVFANERAEQLLGMACGHGGDAGDAGEMSGFRPDGRPLAREDWPLARALASGEEVRVEEIELARPDGSRVAVEAGAAPVRDGQGRIAGAVATFCDATERAGERRELAESRRRFERIAYATPDILYLFDRLAKRTVFVNREALSVLGYPPGQIEALSGEEIAGLVHPDDRPGLSAHNRGFETAGDDVALETEYRMRHADGTYRWIRSREVVFSRDPADGRARQVLGVAQDVTARRRSEQRAMLLAAAASELAGALDPLDPLDADTALEQAVRRIVPAFADWCFLHLVEEDGSFGRVIVRNADPAKDDVREAMIRYCESDPGGPHPTEQVIATSRPELVAEVDEEWIRARTRDEEHRRLVEAVAPRSVMLVPLLARGRLLGVLSLVASEPGREPGRRYDEEDLAFARELAARMAVALDNARLYQEAQAEIAERREAERALRQSEERYREADRKKDEFLAMLAHELRNPLAPLRNWLEILKLHPYDENTVERARDSMERQIGHVSRLVDDLLDVSRIARGGIQLLTERLDLAAVIDRAVESCVLLKARQHDLRISLPKQPLIVQGDGTRLAQVFANLLDNAAKYTPEGGWISVIVDRDGPTAEVRVRDTGVGIPPSMLGKVFDLFTQLDSGLERTGGGLGIGLTLVRRLVEMHGGTVEARSEGSGRGCEMMVRLPLAEAPVLPEWEAAPPGLEDQASGLRVLVVEDNLDAAESLAMLLTFYGHESYVAHDGESGLELAARHRPQVVLLDLGLPGMDGYEVADRLRRTPMKERLWLVALTGYGSEEDRRRTREVGFDHHLVKPVEPQRLRDLLASVAPPRPVS